MMKSTAGVVLAVVLSVITVALLAVGAWQLHWWMAKSTVQHRYDINTNTQQYQSSKIAQLRDLAHDLSAPGLPDSQRQYLSSEFCSVYQLITPPPPANTTADLLTAHTSFCPQG